MLLSALGTAGLAGAQQGHQQEEDYQVYGDHPRLYLNARRLRLLQRERERTSIRWMQFETLVAGKAQMPEPGFAHALYFRVAKNREFGNQAVTWALQSSEIRQIAIVFDWCQDLLTEPQAKQLAARLRQFLAKPAAGAGVAAMRDPALAAIVL